MRNEEMRQAYKDSGLSYNEIVRITGVKKNTLASWLTLKREPSEYAFRIFMEKLEEEVAKRKGMSVIPKNREVTNRNIVLDKEIILYHGSRGGIEGDIKPVSRKRCDFGSGFYMCMDEMPAKSMVADADVPYIYKLKFDIKNAGKVLVLNETQWLFSILAHRKNINAFNKLDMAKEYEELIAGYDVIIGRTADGCIRQALNSFSDNIITDKGLEYCMASVDYGLQVVARTEKACGCISVMSGTQIKGTELAETLEYSKRIQYECNNAVDRAVYEYSDNGKKILSVIEDEKINENNTKKDE